MSKSIPVSINRRASSVPNLEEDLQRARRLADWLDAKFSIGGIRFGMDALIGLVPVVGDLATSLVGLFPLFIAQRHGLGKIVRTRMLLNLLLDWLIGLIPFLGDAFDIGFKSHLRNMKLLENAVKKAGR